MRNVSFYNFAAVFILISVATLFTGCSTFNYQSSQPSPLVQNILASHGCPSCNLRGQGMTNLDLKNFNFEGADLREVNFGSSDLSGANLSQSDMRNARLDQAKLFAANLRGADLRGVNLIDVRLAGADLRDTDLRHIDSDDELDLMELTGVRLDGARFKDGVTCGSFPKKGGWGCRVAQ